LAVKLPPADASKQATALSRQISELAARPRDPDALNGLAQAFAALAGKLTPTEASKQTATLCKQIVERAAETTDPRALGTLAQAFAVLAGKPSPAEASKQTAALCKQIVERAAETTDPYALDALAQAFAALAVKLSPTDAPALGKQIGELAAKTTNPIDLRTLAQAFLVLRQQLSHELANEYAGFLASRLARTIHQTRDRPVVATSISTALDELCGLLSPRQLLELLKQPGCVEPGRTVVLKQLGRRYGRNFQDVWELVDHLDRHAPAMDYTLPLNREQWARKASR
jgi:hypothetical protein